MHDLELKMVHFAAFVLALLGVCLPNVLSLECYSCFSYESNAECENQHHLKKIKCHGRYDTCLKFEMKIRILEAINGSAKYVLNPGFARYCGKKSDCRQSPQICRHTFRNYGEVKSCKITCCDEDIEKSKCHETPHYPGNVGPTNILPTTNRTDGKPGVNGGQQGTHLAASIWFLFMTGALIWMSV